MTYPIEHIKSVAKMLVDNEANIEYNRGICELIAYLTPSKGLDASEVAEIIAKELSITKIY